MVDGLDAALGSVRVEGSMVGRSLVAAPWAMEMASELPCSLAAIVRGEAWLRHGDAAPVHLGEGSVVVTCGPSHLHVGDHPDTPLGVRIRDREECFDVITGESVAERDRIGSRTWGDPDAPGEVILGAYRTGDALFALLAEDLPTALVVAPDPSVAPVIAALVAETSVERPGQQVVVDRLMELLLFAAIRAWLASPASGDLPRWSTALVDPIVGPALRAMHAEPAWRWTVADLAEVGHVSRAGFARRFGDLVGEAPMAHLTRWRMAMAADVLQHEHALGLAAIAAQFGYADAFGFSAAFRRVRGQSPSTHRRTAQLRSSIPGAGRRNDR